jgi:hypothetical protein
MPATDLPDDLRKKKALNPRKPPKKTQFLEIVFKFIKKVVGEP